MYQILKRGVEEPFLLKCRDKNKMFFIFCLDLALESTKKLMNWISYFELFRAIKHLGEGHNYEFHNVVNQKEHRKIWIPSLHPKSLFSWSLLRHFRCSDFTYGVKKDHNIENQNINYLWHITYGYQGLWGPGGLGSIRLG